MSKPETLLPEVVTDWEKHWVMMPEFRMKDLMSWQSTVIHFTTLKDREDFSKLIKQRMSHTTRSIWIPKADIGRFAGITWKSSMPMHELNPRYPIYIISKGRWKSRKTARALDKIGVRYQIVVEPQEYEKYAAVIDPKKILQLPKENYGGGCSIPARNWVWKHAKDRGAERHWILDDNIEGFFRLNDNLKVPVSDGVIFRAAENFVDRYENIGIAGFNYFMFAPRKSGDIKPYTLNTRVYSCILIRNDMKVTEVEGTGKNKIEKKVNLRWRGRYNEDTDLSLRALKEGYCTVLFNVFLAFKSTTMSMKGGNTESLYAQGGGFDGRLEMAKSLKEQHPDLVKITRKWDRWQHHVNYKPFQKNKLKPVPNLKLDKKDNNLGMEIVRVMKKKKRAEELAKKKKAA